MVTSTGRMLLKDAIVLLLIGQSMLRCEVFQIDYLFLGILLDLTEIEESSVR